MLDIRIKFNERDLTRIIKKIDRYPKNFEDNLNVELSSIGSTIVSIARMLAPVGVTGRLGGSIDYSIKRNAISITSTMEYAKYQEFGFAPHRIPLWWITNPGLAGVYVSGSPFVTVSKHTPFIRPAIEMAKPEISHTISRVAHKSWE